MAAASTALASGCLGSNPLVHHVDLQGQPSRWQMGQDAARQAKVFESSIDSNAVLTKDLQRDNRTIRSAWTSQEQQTAGTVLQNFYKNQNILITGGTGFMGKILIDKLLRSCPDLDTIYLLIRPKKGKDVHTRIKEIFDDPVFDLMKSEVPKYANKIVVVAGDCGVAGLGLSLGDRETLVSKINIVFHAAATVRFDEKIRTALAINVHGIKDMMHLCRSMGELKVLIHVSTAYSHCVQRQIDERFYRCPVKFGDLVKLVEKLDDKALEDITPKILGQWPNTYAFTKALAEDVVRENCIGLPMGIYRPAIVTSSFKEPLAGWVDNLYGPTGVVAGAGTGVLRTLHCHSDLKANIVPVDLCVNGLIASAWDVKQHLDERKNDNMLIYNYVSTVDNPITWNDYMEYNRRYGFEFPFSSAIWYICFTMNRSAALNTIYMIFLHFLPAIMIDGLALCVGQKPRLLKVYKKIHKFSNVISYFCTTPMEFSNENVRHMWRRLNEKDREIFDFNIANVDWKEYFIFYIRGIRLYLFKDDLSTLETSRRKWNRFYWLHQMIKSLFMCIFVYGTWSILSGLFDRLF